MKKIITLLSLMLCMFVTAQENATGEYMYIFHSDNRIERVEVAKIDSVTFVDPYQAVDLGLPSGIKWASFNVGARAPWEYGGYYAWGETEEKEDYSWETYKWCNGSNDTMTKYCTNSRYGTIDNKIALDPEDDVAYVKWGGEWRIPTSDEIEELKTKCTWQETILNGINGYEITGPNGNSIFMPVAGYGVGNGVYDLDGFGRYWSSELKSGSNDAAYGLDFGNGYYWNGDYRWHGRSVRPVCGTPAAPIVNYTVSVLGNENGIVLINGENVVSASVADGTEVTVTAIANDGYEFAGWFIGDSDTAVSTDAVNTFTVSQDIALVAKYYKTLNTNGYDFVDLGLPSGIKWAAYNVGATKPEECGGYYAWGETEEKEDYSWETYKWCNGSSNTITKYCINDGYGTVDGKITLDPEDDVAHVKWGGDWRMPTEAEQAELRNNCDWEWTEVNGVSGYRVKSRVNDNSIFFPAAGYRLGTDIDRGAGNGYCSNAVDSDFNDNACGMRFEEGNYDWSCLGRSNGSPVRPVCGAPVAPVVNYTVSVLNNENGIVLINGENVVSASFANGTEVTVTATANDGYEFAGWFIGDSDTAVSTDAAYTFTVGEDVALVARFEKNRTYLNGYEYIDLGLPSGTKWAAYNVGATKPEEFGGYYAWGETEEKDDYSESTYKFGYYTTNDNGLKKYYHYSKYIEEQSSVFDREVLEPEDDVAYVKWGGGWRMPTNDECAELLENCTQEWATINGVKGCKLTGPNGNTIFLPATGKISGTIRNDEILGFYWNANCGSGNTHTQTRGFYLTFRVDLSSYCWITSNYRETGMPVRPVCK